MKKYHAFAASCVIGAATLSAPAQAACWTEQSATAAQVRTMETLLMVSALRCRNQGVNLLDGYNQFVRQSRGALDSVNGSLRTHFASSGGMNAYDRYVTSVANRYGGGVDGLSCDDVGSILSDALAAKGSLPALTAVARSAGVAPSLPGGRCLVTAALKR
jgi:hypothetical protein